MATELMSIGELARRAQVPTSTVRYYERRGLFPHDERQSGQRRYTAESLRRIVFIGMLQDAGLSLDDIAGVLAAGSVADWKQIATQRLAALDAELERLSRSKELLEGALLCRYDHPLDQCRVMGFEIDRRIDEGVAKSSGE